MNSRPADFAADGWVLLRAIFTDDRLDRLRGAMRKLSERSDEAVRHREGAVYAARNVLDLCPEIDDLWRHPALLSFLEGELGRGAGLVRALYFDKPPEQTWALPWHKDLLIAVEPFRDVPGYSPARPRAGVLHCEPPVEVLSAMVTLRIHLDPMTMMNGPLQVLSGSHRTGKTLRIEEFTPTTILSEAGEVLAMRPLLVHCSGRSDPGCDSHRRVLHLEFSAGRALPGGVRWHKFLPVER